MIDEELSPLGIEQSETKDMRTVLSQYTRYWYLFLFSTVLSLSSAYLYLRYYAVPKYSIYSTILIKDDKSNADALSDLGSFKSTRNIDNEIQILGSKRLITRVVSELGLSTKYTVKGKVRDQEIYGSGLPIKVLIKKIDYSKLGDGFTVRPKPNNAYELDDYTGHVTIHHFGEQIQSKYGVLTIFTKADHKISDTRIAVQFQNIDQVADYYNNVIAIVPVNRQASVLSITLKDPIPEKAKDIIDKLMEVYNVEAVEDKNVMATNTLRFLDDRLKKLTSGLSGVEKNVETFKSANGLTDITTQATNYTSQASNYNNQISEWAIQIDVLESIENYLKKNAGNHSTVPSTLGIKDETLLGLIRKFNELQLERERLLRTAEPNNPIVQNLDEQLINLRVNILENLRNIKQGIQITSDNLRASSGQFQSKIKRMPGMERELLEINRQQSIKQNIYSYLLQKREETAISLASATTIARVIDPATGGNYPIDSESRSLYLSALLLGLGLPLAVVYLINLLDNKVRTQKDIGDATATPIIGEIAHNRSNEAVVVREGMRSPIAEMFRLVRTNLNFVALGKENIVVMVTSSMWGEGKTFFSINLAASLVLTGRRVVLLDLDLRNPNVANELVLINRVGVSEYLVSDDISIDDIIRPVEHVPGLFVGTSGAIPPNPSELVMSPKFAHLIQELKASFDYIIIDTPPVGQVADSFILAPLTDFSIYLVRYNYTKKAQLKIIANIFKNKMLKRPMIVLNDAKPDNGNNYGYGYGYGYDQKNMKKRKTMG